MAKFIFTPGKEFADTPKAVKVSYTVLAIAGVLTIADSFLSGKLLGLFHGLEGWGFIVLGLVAGYLFYDTGNTLVRNRIIAKDFALGLSVVIIGLGIWRVVDGVMSGIGAIVLGTVIIALMMSKGVKNFLLKK